MPEKSETVCLCLRWKPEQSICLSNTNVREKRGSPKNPNTAILRTEAGGVQLGNPFRGVFVLGAAGSGKSESIAVPLLSEFVRMGFAGVVYDFKFPTLAKMYNPL